MAANIPTANNNPGNIKGNDGKFITFKTPLEGQVALYNDLTIKMTGKSKTGLNGDSSLYDFANTYAPKSDGNDPANYAANIANELGISPDTKIGTLTGRIDEFAKAIAKHEGYKGAWVGGATNPATPKGQLVSNQTQATPVGKGFLPTTPVTPNISVPTTQQINPTPAQKTGNTLNTVAGVMGMQPFGQGIATAIRQFTGGGNEEGDAEGAAAHQLSAIMAKYPPGSLERKAAMANFNRLYSGGITKESEIDPGTTLSKKDVLKSAAATGLWALSGGSMPTEGMQTGVLAQKGVNGVTQIGKAVVPNLIKKAAVSGISGSSKALPLLGKAAPVIKGLGETGLAVGILKELWDLNHK